MAGVTLSACCLKSKKNSHIVKTDIYSNYILAETTHFHKNNNFPNYTREPGLNRSWWKFLSYSSGTADHWWMSFGMAETVSADALTVLNNTDHWSECSKHQLSLPASETWRRTPCLVTRFLQTADRPILIGSAYLHRRVQTTQRMTARRRSTRSSTGEPILHHPAEDEEVFKSPTMFNWPFCCSFLCLVPDEAKSSYQVEGTGYDTYLRDAHRQVSASAQLQQKAFFFWRFSVWVNDSFQFKDYCGVCLHWDWRGSPKPLEKCNLDLPFFEGHFLKVLFDRMGRILDQVSLKCSAHNWHIYHTTNVFRAYWHSNTCLFAITLSWVVWLDSSCIIDVLLCPAALWCEPAGDGCSVQTVFAAPPSFERVPPGSLYQPGPRLQVSLLRHCQGESLLSVTQLLSDPLLIGVIAILQSRLRGLRLCEAGGMIVIVATP